MSLRIFSGARPSLPSLLVILGLLCPFMVVSVEGLPYVASLFAQIPWRDPLSVPVMVLKGLALALNFPVVLFIARKLQQRDATLERIAVGDDGVRVTTLFKKRFIPLRDIVTVGTNPARPYVLIEVRNGEVISIRMPDPDEVAEEIRARLERARERPPTKPLPLLADTPADPRRWLQNVTNLRVKSFRDAATTQEQLLHIAEDPDAAAGQRIGAALSLTDAPNPIRLRVRAAAESTAHPLIAEALVAAIDDQLEEDLLKRIGDA